MRTLLKIMVLLLSSQLCSSQMLTRKTMHGHVVNDSIAIENGLVFNINSKTGDVIDKNGAFGILAKVNDTLLVTSLGFRSRKVVLSAADVNSSFYKIRLKAVATELLSVIVYAKQGSQPKFVNTQNVVDKLYVDDNQSLARNAVMMPTGTGDPYAMDVIRVYNKVFKSLFKDHPGKVDFVTESSFSNVAMHSVSYSFFTDKLNMKDDEIALFLMYCENDPKSKTMVSVKQKFEIMDFLITKYDSFKQIVSVEK